MRALALLVAAAVAAGCGGTTRYVPSVVARGELTLRYDDGFEAWAPTGRVARGLGWRGLPAYVRCVPEAHAHAKRAVGNGFVAYAASTLGALLGVASIGGLVGYGVDSDHGLLWLGGGVGVAVVGALFAGMGRLMKNAANGHAVDALNLYNDSVGSLGASCDDLRYPPPVAEPIPDGYVVPPPPPVAPPPGSTQTE